MPVYGQTTAKDWSTFLAMKTDANRSHCAVSLNTADQLKGSNSEVIFNQ